MESVGEKYNFAYVELTLNHKSKRGIINELDNLGINKSTLFPEIDKVADYIKEKYIQK